MRLARHPALIAAFLALGLVAVAMSWPMIWPTISPLLQLTTRELSTEQPAVNGPVAEMPRFRCDSLAAQDCFEMFQRHLARTANAPVETQHLLNRFTPRNQESAACALNAGDRDDRCMLRNGR
jgi:hypothetical protein